MMIIRTEAQQTIQANEVQHLTESELMDVLECARKTSRRDHSLILTMYWHGLRNQEVARLRLSDIDFTAGLVTVQRQKSSLKTTQPLVKIKGHPAKCELAALKTWLKERGEQISEYIFTSNRDGSCLGQKQINRIFAKYCEMASQARKERGDNPIAKSTWHAHAIKHTRGTLLAEKGASLLAIKLVLGHKSSQSSERYLHPTQRTAWTETMKLDTDFASIVS
jgi:type 1 fimbriae regulatory protein FimB/type 1 fimbriae regulatory protein FimE